MSAISTTERQHPPQHVKGSFRAALLWSVTVRLAVRLVAGLVLALAASTALAQSAPAAKAQPSMLELDHVFVQTSLYTRHFSPDPEHNNQQDLISVELHNPHRWLVGAAWLKNSFNQPTWYWYAGREFPLWEPGRQFSVRAKLTAGLLRGYKDKYRDKIPFNHSGIAPAILPSIGVRYKRVEADIIIYGTAGMTVTAGVRF